MFKTDPSRPQMLLREIPQSYDPDVKYALAHSIYDTVRKELKKSQEEYRMYRSKKVSASREPLTVGARVFVKNVKRKSKLAPLWLGPMRVLQEVGPAQFKLRDLSTGRTIVRHKEHLIAKRQGDMNRWLVPNSDEPFPHTDLFGDSNEDSNEDVGPEETHTEVVDGDSSDDSDWDEISSMSGPPVSRRGHFSDGLGREPTGDVVRTGGRDAELTCSAPPPSRVPPPQGLTSTPSPISSTSSEGLREEGTAGDCQTDAQHRTDEPTDGQGTNNVEQQPTSSDVVHQPASTDNPGESSLAKNSPPQDTSGSPSTSTFREKLGQLGRTLRKRPRVNYKKLHFGKLPK